MAGVKRMVFAESCAELEESVVELRRCWEERYPQVIDYLQRLDARRQDWALYLRSELPARGHNTNNVLESAFRVMTDSVAYKSVELCRTSGAKVTKVTYVKC